MLCRGLKISRVANYGLRAAFGRMGASPFSSGGPWRKCMSSKSINGDGVEIEDTVVSRCTQKIKDAVVPVKLVVQAAHDDPNGSHITVEVVSKEFEGQRTVQRQRLVYKAIWDEMADGGSVHAVDRIIAQTPEEAGM